MFITIAIPSYNRPITLIELLKSIDFNAEDIEVVICEDNSPKRAEIRESVEIFKSGSNLNIKYFENEINMGYDENLWELLRKSSGKYIIYMGDDDEFIKGALKKFYLFLKENQDLGYILKAHIAIKTNGEIEYFNYYPENKFFEKGKDTIIELFRKSVLISGFCINTENLLQHYNKSLKGTLLTQLFLLSIQCLKYPAAYYKVPLVSQNENKNTIPYFGSSKNEEHLYIPGQNSIVGSLNFMNNFNMVLDIIEDTQSIKVKNQIKKDMSKYCYPTLAIQRHQGIIKFNKYAFDLSKLGYNTSFYFYIYYFLLIIFGKQICDSTIVFIKSKLKTTPKL